MDNAGGHGTEDAKKIYTDAIKKLQCRNYLAGT